METDFTPEWKKTIIGIVITAGLILLAVGATLLAIAALTESTYQSMVLPADVRILVDTTRQTSYALLAIGGGLVAIGLIERY